MGPSGVAAVAAAVLLGVPFGALWARLRPPTCCSALNGSSRPCSLGRQPRMFWAFVVLALSGFGALYYYLQVMNPYPRQRR